MNSTSDQELWYGGVCFDRVGGKSNALYEAYRLGLMPADVR